MIRSVTKQFNIDVIVDAGDITDHGSAPENAYVDADRDAGRAVRLGARQPRLGGDPGRGRGAAERGGARRTEPVEVAGCGSSASATRGSRRTRTPATGGAGERVAGGAGDGVRAAGGGGRGDAGRRRGGARRGGGRRDGRDRAAGAVRALPPAGAAPAARRDAVVLPGLDRRLRAARAGGTRSRPRCGPRCCTSTGTTRALQAWDDITLGGLGLVSAKIERRIVGQQFPELAPTVSPDARRRPDAVAAAPELRASLARLSPPASPLICGLLWRAAGASPMLSGSPTAKDAVGLRPHRLAAQDAALSRR